MKTNLPKRLLRALPFIIVTLGIFLALPFAAIALGNGALYVVGVPLLDCCGVCAVGYFYGRKNGRDPLMPVISGVLFVPIMFIFYNSSAWIYLLLLPIFSYVGECIGTLYGQRFGK